MQMGSMGADLFEMSWVQSIVLFFSYLAWALYVTGIVWQLLSAELSIRTDAAVSGTLP